ncbi:CGNR zinc finger domain-containing protein [Nesterenkonia sp. CF4.4]|uniref:CGNR zinc finger domain-containing protein n=1 Tax=Nesterenkonia sp. CF4.4 TaxID=3373079 RepID=UPI003EE7838E
MTEDEDLLMELLNSTPVVEGESTDILLTPHGGGFATRFGGSGSASERTQLTQMRQHLQETIRGRQDAALQLGTLLSDVALVPEVTPHGIQWHLDAPSDLKIAARAAIAWSRIIQEAPGRLRPCANEACNLFLLDRSRPGTAKWCSMATCGNRMKARAHARRRG